MAYSKLPKISIHLFGYIFSPRWLPTIVTLIILPILISLGMWQLHRAHEKRLMERDFATHTTPLMINQIHNPNNKNLRYQSLQVRGFFDNDHTIFLDNKTYHQQVGYQVLSPFVIPGEKNLLLVNRGFIAVQDRSKLPKIDRLDGIRSITGLIYFPSKSFILKKETVRSGWPWIIQAINWSDLEKNLQHPSYPFYLLLNTGDDSALVRDWHPVNFPSYRHTGYAIQWFLLALTLIVIYLSLNTSRIR